MVRNKKGRFASNEERDESCGVEGCAVPNCDTTPPVKRKPTWLFRQGYRVLAGFIAGIVALIAYGVLIQLASVLTPDRIVLIGKAAAGLVGAWFVGYALEKLGVYHQPESV